MNLGGFVDKLVGHLRPTPPPITDNYTPTESERRWAKRQAAAIQASARELEAYVELKRVEQQQ